MKGRPVFAGLPPVLWNGLHIVYGKKDIMKIRSREFAL